MNSHNFAACAGALLSVAFLLYYIIYLKSVPLSFIMIVIIVMICVNMYEETKRQNNNGS
jgi:uncharacterized membrane protein AbrB (regulator of aidB expression)